MLGSERAWAMFQTASVDASPAGAIASMLLAVQEVEARGLGALDRVVLAALQFGKHLGSVVVRSPEAKIAVAQESPTPALLQDSGSNRA